MKPAAVVAIALAACGPAAATAPVHQTTPPSGPSLAGDLRAAAKGQPVLLATNSTGVAAYTPDGTLLRQLTSDGSQGQQYDARREILFYRDATNDQLSALDLRVLAPQPVVIARGAQVSSLWSDDGRHHLGELRLRWANPPAVDIVAGPCAPPGMDPCPPEMLAQHDAELRGEVAQIQLVDTAWIAASAARTLRATRPLHRFAGARASLAPTDYEVVADRYCEHDCMATCLIHDVGHDRWLEPKMPDEWRSDRGEPDSGDGLCALDFDASTTYWVSEHSVCTFGRACTLLDDVDAIVGWLDPGIETDDPVVEQP